MEKSKLETVEIENPLDSIGCSCNSCNTSKPANIAVNTNDHDDSHNHDHDHSHDVSDVFEKKEEKSKLLNILKQNLNLMFSFILFFTALFAPLQETLQLALYLVAYILVAKNVLIKAVKNVFAGHMLDENFLMAIASVVAFLIGEYAEGVAVMLFYNVGQITEDYALNRSKNSISKLLDLKPDFANVRQGSELIRKKPKAVNVGDIIVIKPGEKVPLDGIVIKGQSNIDAAMLTGESLPSYVTVDQEVYSGTINQEGVLEVRVTKAFGDSTVSKILKLVQRAGQNKAHTERFITRFAKVYTPLVVAGAALIAIVPTLLGGEFSTWVYRGAIFLVVSCPCALVISVPLGYFGGIGGAARKGILVKGGHFLESLRQASTVVFDKTGTLTKGNFKFDHMTTYGMDESEALEISAHLEQFSTHPIGKAVVAAYSGIYEEDKITEVQEVPGKGVQGFYKGQVVRLGNAGLMEDHKINLPEIKEFGTILYLSIGNDIKAVFNIVDELKDETKAGLNALKSLGIKRFVMLTGDRQSVADEVAGQLGIGEVHAQLLPEDKLNYVEQLINEKEKVVFIGDGINDAPVLRRADVGIAMGNLGSDVAIESSDVVLMVDEITKVAEGIKVAKFTSKIIWQNIVLALGIKILIMILGTLGYANLWTAVFGDVGVAFIAILNSGRAIYNK